MSQYENISNVFKPQYENFIGGKWVAPVKGAYSDLLSPRVKF